MNAYSNLNSDVYSSEHNGINTATHNNKYNNTHDGEHCITMNLCSQAQMLEDTDNILSRMDKLRSFAREQQTKREKSQRQQTSFCF
ncbi:MAG: hypothetical protein ACI9UT_001713 [Flavobacteriales bacterium]|jgi:hypothetical protein